MRKKLSLLAAFVGLSYSAICQTTLFVPGTYATIQDAVNASTHPLDVVQVSAGVYPQVVNVNKSLAIKGPNAGTPGTGARAAEAIVSDAKITVSGAVEVTIDGLRIFQTNNTADAVLLGGSSVVTVKNCVIERAGVSPGALVRSITTSAGTGPKTIEANKFSGDPSGGLFGSHLTWNSGIYINGAGSTVLVKNNHFQYCRTAMSLDDFNNGITIMGNIFENNGTHMAFGGVLPTNGQYALPANEFRNPADAIINLSKVDPAFRLDITSCTFNGASFASYPLASLFQIEQGMYHRGRSARNGLVTYVPNHQYVIQINPSIQAAINYGVDDNIIHVGPGTYTENLNLNKKMNILGSGSGADPSNSTIVTQTAGGAVDTRVGVIQLNTTGWLGSPIKLQDMRLKPIGMAGISVGRFTQQTGTSVGFLEVTNVHIYGSYKADPCGEQERGLYVDQTSSLFNAGFLNCAFNGLEYGWYLHKKVGNDASNVSLIQVIGCEFKDNVSKGLYAEKLSDAIFEGCTVQNNGDAAWGNTCTYFKPWLSGFDINLKAGSYTNIAIRNSVFTGNGTGQAKDGVAIMIKARDDGSTYSPFPATLSHVLIENCLITGNERGIRIGEPDKNNAGPTDVVITKNSIFNNIKTYSGADGSAYGNIINTSAAPVDGACNWLGSDQQATIASGIAGLVTFVPYLQNGNDGDVAIGFQPTAACIGPPAACSFSVVCSLQGLTHSGSMVPAARSKTQLAEVPQKNDVAGTINFYSLGYGGYIILKSSCPVRNGAGNDIKVWETTYGAQPVNDFSDRARVYASQDGVNFFLLGTATYDGSFDLETAGISWAQFFRIQDATQDTPGNPANADAYDLDGIEVLNGYAEGVVLEPVALGGAATVCGGTQGKTRNFSNVAGIRSNPLRATGLPENDNSYNFYALGFGGDICLHYPFAIFDGPGGELQLVETTFGNLPCGSYRERAEVSVSFNGVDWNVLGQYCQDYADPIDIGAANSGIQYVRLRDVSDREDFTSPSADGYDVDAVVALASYTGTPVCSPTSNGRKAIAGLFDQTTVPNEFDQLAATAISENEMEFHFTLPAETATLTVRNYAGQQLASISLSGKLWETKITTVNTAAWAKGVYFVTLTSPVQKETIRVMR